jgi:hypothetical protein
LPGRHLAFAQFAKKVLFIPHALLSVHFSVLKRIKNFGMIVHRPMVRIEIHLVAAGQSTG